MTWTQATVMRAVKAALEPAIGGRLHGLRRSAATHLAQQGETPMRIARVLGWSQGDAEAMAAVYIQDEAL